ncbi:MAG: cytochrome C oxidase Cbb3 [Bacteroidota bacterium]
MFKHYFERIAGQVSFYPVLSLSIFFLFFLGLLVWVITADKNYISRMQSLPLENGEKSGPDLKQL